MINEIASGKPLRSRDRSERISAEKLVEKLRSQGRIAGRVRIVLPNDPLTEDVLFEIDPSRVRRDRR